MANLPTRPAVAALSTRDELLVPVVSPITRSLPTRTFIQDDLTDWEVKVATSLSNAVPADVNRTVITMHKHEIIIERSDPLYRSLTIVENALIICSSVLLMGVSASSVLFALSAMTVALY
jgi:hypothetical protein